MNAPRPWMSLLSLAGRECLRVSRLWTQTMLAPVVSSVLFIVVFGLSLGAELDIVAYLTSRYFGRENFGFLFGTIGGFLGLATGNGPVILNAIYDATGSYDPGLWAAMPLCVISALSFLLLGPYPRDSG